MKKNPIRNDKKYDPESPKNIFPLMLRKQKKISDIKIINANKFSFII